MNLPVVPVSRYWSPVGHDPSLEPSGFLAHSFLFDGPADDALLETDALASAPALVLLGAPGSGKSVELRRLAASAPADRRLYLDLGTLSDPQDLRADLFHHPAFLDWQQGRADLHLFLDALDEGAYAVETIAARLRRHLDGPPERLHLRITCRPADWPRSLGDHLQSFFGEEHVQIRTLAPLRASGALRIARGALSDRADAFMTEVHHVGVGALAALPLTLRLLLTIHDRDRALPAHAPDVFTRAMRHLCVEQNLGRQEAGRTGALVADNRLALASRAAAALRLSGRARIALGVPDPLPTDAIATSDLALTSAEAPLPYPTDERALADLARHAALFEPAGPGTVRFAHAAFGEFLAARYLHESSTPADAALALLSHPDGGLLPQHRQTAGWLAALSRPFFDLLAESEPGVVLLYTPDPPPERRAILLSAFFDACDRQEKNAYDPDRKRLAALEHPGLEDQLRSVLTGPHRSVEARRLALFVARDVGVTGLGPDALRLGLDADAPIRVRYLAVHAAANLGANLDRLLPLASVPVTEDPTRDVALAAREVLFPSRLSIRDLIRLAAEDADATARRLPRRGPPVNRPGIMAPPHAQQLASLLSSALRDAPDQILADALADLKTTADPDVYHREAAAVLVTETFDRLPHDALAPALASFLLGPTDDIDLQTPTLRYRPWNTRTDSRKRHALLVALVRASTLREYASDELYGWSRLVAVSSERGLLQPSADETGWLLQCFEDALSSAERVAWADLLEHATRSAVIADGFVRDDERPDPEQYEPLLGACVLGPYPSELAGLYFRLFAPRDTKSSEADRWRNAIERRDEVERERAARRTPHDPPLLEQLRAALDTPDPLDAWRSVRPLLSLHPDDAEAWGAHPDTDPTQGALWKSLTQPVREAVLRLSARVVATSSLDPDTVASHAERPRPYALPYVEAFFILVWADRFDPADFDDGPLVALAAMALANSRSTVDEISRARDRLRDEAWNRNSDALARAVVSLAGHPALAYRLLVQLLPLWDPRFEEPFLSAARALPTRPNDSVLSGRRDELLHRLIELGSEPALDLVLQEIAFLRTDMPPDPDDPEPAPELSWRRWQSAHAFTAAPARTWDVLGPRILTDDAFARWWLQGLATHDRRSRSFPECPPSLLADLFRRIYALFPPSQYMPRPSGTSFTPSVYDHVQSLATTVLGVLRSRASAADLDALSCLHTDLPGADLAQTLVIARRRHRELHPSYPSPTEALRLAADPQTRPLRSDAELQCAVVLAFGRVQREIAASLQREASIFWEPVAPDSEGRENRPRDENYASDRIVTMLRRHLQPRGVLVDRETETNRGDRTDFLVQAPTDPAAGRTAPARVVVEVKGVWHREVETALDTQLGRYLRQSGRTHGVFLVLAFDSEAWSSADGDRRRRGTRRSADELREIFTTQATQSDVDIVPLVIEVPFGR